MQTSSTTGAQVHGALKTPQHGSVLTPEALELLADLLRTFGPRLDALLSARRTRRARWDAGEPLHFLPETIEVRASDWKVAPLPQDLLDRRVEITGPVDRKMIVNALNSGASVFMADFEDANAPTWDNVVLGQAWVREAAAGTLAFDDPGSGKAYRIGDHPAVHLADGRQVTASLVRELLRSEMDDVRRTVGDAGFEGGRFRTAVDLFEKLTTADTLEDFLTIPAYDLLLQSE